ncbi:hypothetical protein BH09PAT4_BH09PAT4_01810 [soil metagenome]
MGFFSKIKQNLQHGGVDISLQAPASISMQDAVMPVVVTVVAKDTVSTINKVRVEVYRQSNNRSFGSTQQASPTSDSIALSENTEVFTLNPGESKSIQLSIVMNEAKTFADALPEGSAMAQVAGAFQRLESVKNVLDQNSYTYSIKGSADVEGVMLDPSASQPLQILKPGQIGGAINLHL